MWSMARTYLKTFRSFVHLRAAIVTTRESLWQLVDAIVCRGRDLLGYLLTWGLRWIVGDFYLDDSMWIPARTLAIPRTGAGGSYARDSFARIPRDALFCGGLLRDTPAPSLASLALPCPFSSRSWPVSSRSFVAVLLFRWLLAERLH